MFNFTSNGVSLTLIRDTRFKDAEEACPLKWRVIHKRKTVYYITGINLLPSEWIDLLEGKRTKEIKNYRDSLQTYYETTIQKNVKQLAENGKFSFELLNVRLSKSVGTDVKGMFEAKIQNLISNDNIKNSIVYKCTLRSIDKFHSKKLSFKDITPVWLQKYQKFMETNGLRYSTIAMYLRTLRAILNAAKDSDLINEADYPFGKNKFQIPIGEGRDLALEMKDIKRIAQYDCKTSAIEMYRDLWLFSYLGSGVNFSDMLRFRYSDIKDNEIYFYRKKTKSTTNVKIEIIIPILPEMQIIIDKWGNRPSAKGFIFPFLNGLSNEKDIVKRIDDVIRRTNRNIKKVTSALDMPDVSTYNCRHTMTTILAKKYVPESYLDQATGHVPSTQTKGYIGKYTKKERFKFNSMLVWSKGRTRKLNENIQWNRNSVKNK